MLTYAGTLSKGVTLMSDNPLASPSAALQSTSLNPRFPNPLIAAQEVVRTSSGRFMPKPRSIGETIVDTANGSGNTSTSAPTESPAKSLKGGQAWTVHSPSKEPSAVMLHNNVLYQSGDANPSHTTFNQPVYSVPEQLTEQLTDFAITAETTAVGYVGGPGQTGAPSSDLGQSGQGAAQPVYAPGVHPYFNFPRHISFYEVDSVPRCAPLCTCRTILDMLSRRMKLCEMMGEQVRNLQRGARASSSTEPCHAPITRGTEPCRACP